MKNAREANNNGFFCSFAASFLHKKKCNDKETVLHPIRRSARLYHTGECTNNNIRKYIQRLQHYRERHRRCVQLSVLVRHFHTSRRRSGFPIRFQSILGNLHQLGLRKHIQTGEQRALPFPEDSRGGLSFGIGLEAWTAANAKECFNIGETVLELGGRIPLTANDILTIGVNSNISVGFEKVYHDGVAYRGLDTAPPRFGACLKLGYEHRF